MERALGIKLDWVYESALVLGLGRMFGHGRRFDGSEGWQQVADGAHECQGGGEDVSDNDAPACSSAAGGVGGACLAHAPLGALDIGCPIASAPASHAGGATPAASGGREAGLSSGEDAPKSCPNLSRPRVHWASFGSGKLGSVGRHMVPGHRAGSRSPSPEVGAGEGVDESGGAAGVTGDSTRRTV